MKSYSPVRYDSFRKLKKFVSWPKPRQFPMCSGFLQPHEGCARATVSAWTFTSSLLKEDIQAISLKLLSRCSKSQEKQSYISATVDMALSIPALGLNRCTRHSWNWIDGLGSFPSRPVSTAPCPSMNTPSGSPLQLNTQSRAKQWPPFSAPCVALVRVPGQGWPARCSLLFPWLSQISKDRDNIKIGLSFQPQACFFTCNSCKYLSPNGIWRSTLYTVFVFSLGIPGIVKINKTKFHLQSLKPQCFPNKHPIHNALLRKRTAPK